MPLQPKHYKQYLKPDSSGLIPRSTYYRWKRQGCLDEQDQVEPKRRRLDLEQEAGPAANSTIQQDQGESESGIPEANCESEEATQCLASFDHIPDVSTQLRSASSSFESGVSISCETAADAPCEGCDSDTGDLDSQSNVNTGNIAEQDSESDSAPDSENETSFEDVSFEFDLNDSSTDSDSQSAFLTPDYLNKPLVENLSRTKFEAMLMVLHIALRHGMTGPFLQDMLQFVNYLVCDDNAIPSSEYLFKKLFDTKGQMHCHFYCPDCEIYLGPSSDYNEGQVQCNECSKTNTVKSMNEGNFFVTVSVKDQLKDLLCRPYIKLVDRERDHQHGFLKDIMDGHIYKSLKAKPGNENALTITFNTDGAAPYKKGANKNSLWPIFFILNEIHPTQRFLLENLMLAGLWFGSCSPNMKVLFTPFVSEMAELKSSGIVWKDENGRSIRSPVYAICCVADSVAKPKVQNVLQYNGSFGCGYCKHPNNPISRETLEEGDVRVGEEGERQKKKRDLRYYVARFYPYRNNSEMRMHMEQSEQFSEGHLMGVKGKSAVYKLPRFDMVFSFGIEWMHAVLEGVIAKMSGLMFDVKDYRGPGKKAPKYYIASKVSLVDKRLKSIRPPTSFSRKPGPMSQRSKYHANEWRSYLLYYCLPCLRDILPSAYYNHLKKLVKALYILLKEAIAVEELVEAESLLLSFVTDFEKLYGVKNMVYNVHLLTHIAHCVYKLGPLWAYSAFTFESGNGHLIRLITGTRGVVTNVCRKYLMAGAAAKTVNSEKYTVSNEVLSFCGSMVTERACLNAFRSFNATLLGFKGLHHLSEEERALLNDADVERVDYYNRVVKNSILYHGSRYSRQENFNDSCVKLSNGSYALLELIFILPGGNDPPTAWSFIRRIFLADDVSDIVPHIHECSLDPYGPLELVCFDSEVASKAILVECDERRYVTDCANRYERD